MKLSKLLENTAPDSSSTTLTSAASEVEQMLISPGAVRLFYHIIGSYFRVLEEHGLARGEYSREIYTIQLKGRNDPQPVTRNFYIPYQPENTRIYTAVDTVSEMLEGAMAQIPEEYVPYSWAHLHPGFSPLPSSTDARNNYAVLDRLGSNNKLTGYDRLTIRQPKVAMEGDQLVLFDDKSKKRVSLKMAANLDGKQPNLSVGEWVDETPVTIYWSKSLIFNGRDLDGFFQSFSGQKGGHDTRFAYSEISVATITHDGTINRSTYEIPIRVVEVANDIVLSEELKAQIEQTLREKVVVPTQRGYRAIPEYMIDQLSKEERVRLEREEGSLGSPAASVAAPAPEPEYAPLNFGEMVQYAIANLFGLEEPPRRLMSRKITMPPPPLKMKVKAFVAGREVVMEREVERT